MATIGETFKIKVKKVKKAEPEPLPKCDECDCVLTEDDEKYWCNSRCEYICHDCRATCDMCENDECDCCASFTDSDDEPEPEPEPEPVKPKQEYKCLTARYQPREQYFKIPAEWDEKDVFIKWGELFYKGEPQDVPEVDSEGGEKYPIHTSIGEIDVCCPLSGDE